jgi:hypothetical protein
MARIVIDDATVIGLVYTLEVELGVVPFVV